MMEFNRGNKICIANTYQCYLKAGLAHLEEDLRISCNMSFPLGIKLVRGAYMEVERRQSFNKGLPDPICTNYALTNEAYDKAVQRLLYLAGDLSHLVVFATHNFDSVKKIAVHSNLPKSVYFAQINGMADPISFGLIHSGHQSLKLIPCGSVADVVPWLARRVQENSVALERVSWDKLLIRKELYRRFRNVVRK
ncbi:hypothetical protein TCAL_04777 [Tigriopus californicus]|uniref:Proline dehydrogenase n=2 Tax=Tigriopus californicus TaxID=6832 RepID=A0A553P242_TIGCA|nr:hypothetical protein TCAL_04777 [Tigriopus californicus]